MRRQDGSVGWRVAQEREVINGWAGAVRGEILRSFGVKVWVFGKRIGEMNGLKWVSEVGKGGEATYG